MKNIVGDLRNDIIDQFGLDQKYAYSWTTEDDYLTLEKSNEILRVIYGEWLTMRSINKTQIQKYLEYVLQNEEYKELSMLKLEIHIWKVEVFN